MKLRPSILLISATLLSIVMVVTPACKHKKPVAEKKPVIYLYPEQEMEVNVKLRLNEDYELKTTEPYYNDGWTVIAKPDGELMDPADGKKYPYLFWEANDYYDYQFGQGFCVMRDSTETFLRRTLTDIGLNEKEREEFISFWAPEMKTNDCNLVSFAGEQFTSRAQLDIQPAPDAILRVFMIFKPVAPGTIISPQTFPPFQRKGFTVVEWGGANVGVPSNLN
jgi:hypothetical protein